MKTFKVVGWYNDNPTDESSTCYSLRVDVQAEDRHMAFDAGETALRKAAARPNNLMNWYVQEEKKR